MIVKDDRTDEQKKTHTWIIAGTDKFMSGSSFAKGGKSIAAWACEPKNRAQVLNWVESRTDMKYVREVCESDRRYRPQGQGHCHIYVVDADHRSIK
jgi:hypothetical protein